MKRVHGPPRSTQTLMPLTHKPATSRTLDRVFTLGWTKYLYLFTWNCFGGLTKGISFTCLETGVYLTRYGPVYTGVSGSPARSAPCLARLSALRLNSRLVCLI